MQYRRVLVDWICEVAEDYKLALEDLTSNLRHEISNLTLIARENTEHAHAISEVLIEHIKRVGLAHHVSFSIGFYSARCLGCWTT